MPAAAAKKPMTYREGRADKSKKPSIEVEINPEGEEEEGMEGEEMDGDKSHSRKRSAKGAKNTKAPMDSDCGCDGAKKGKKCTCDGSCGGYAKKMDRNDALTPQEYLAACDLGIQGRSRSYIRARLDATERLDKKCGASAIPDNKKCNKGSGGPAQSKPGGVTLTGRETGIFSRERIKREGYYGSHGMGGDPFSRKSQAKRGAALNAGVGAAAGALIGHAAGGGVKGALIGTALGAAYGGIAGAAAGAGTAQFNRMSSRAANRSLKREQFEKPIAASYKKKRASMKAGGASRQQLNEYDMKTAMKLASGYDRINQSTRGRYGADSIWAEGF